MAAASCTPAAFSPPAGLAASPAAHRPAARGGAQSGQAAQDKVGWCLRGFPEARASGEPVGKTGQARLERAAEREDPGMGFQTRFKLMHEKVEAMKAIETKSKPASHGAVVD